MPELPTLTTLLVDPDEVKPNWTPPGGWPERSTKAELWFEPVDPAAPPAGEIVRTVSPPPPVPDADGWIQDGTDRYRPLNSVPSIGQPCALIGFPGAWRLARLDRHRRLVLLPPSIEALGQGGGLLQTLYDPSYSSVTLQDVSLVIDAGWLAISRTHNSAVPWFWLIGTLVSTNTPFKKARGRIIAHRSTGTLTVNERSRSSFAFVHASPTALFGTTP